MIYESCYWKDDLLDLSRKIKMKYIKLNRECDDKYLVDFEKDIMIAAYSVRKLLEAGKICDEIANTKINVFVYKARRNVNRMNWHDLYENYEDNYTKSKKYLRTICNTIIHSYCFIPGFNKKDNLMYLYLNSAKQKDIEIYSISLEEFAKVLEKVGSDYPNEGTFTYNKEKADYEYHSKTIYPEPWVFTPYIREYKSDKESVIKKIVDKYGIPEYKVKEILKELSNRDEAYLTKDVLDFNKC